MLLKISAFWLKLQIVPAFLAAKLRRRLLVSIGFRSTVNRLQNERIIVVKQIPFRIWRICDSSFLRIPGLRYKRFQQ